MMFQTSFIWPVMLYTLILAPLLIAFYVRLQRRRRLSPNLGSMARLTEGSGKTPGRRRHLPAMFFLAGLVTLMLALARPEMVVSMPSRAGAVILAFDVSGSMAATDLEPTRIEAAKAAAREFVERQPSSMEIGVVAFSDSGFSVQIPTKDQEAIFAAINRLTPERATSLANGILVSIKTISTWRGMDEAPDGAPDGAEGSATAESSAAAEPARPLPGAILLLTDGENTADPDPFEAARIAAENGVRIYAIGVGSPEGATLEIEGFSIHSRLDEATLQQLADISGGEYFNAQDQEQLQEIYKTIRPEMMVRPEKMEVTAILAGVSLLMLLVGGAFSVLWFGRFP